MKHQGLLYRNGDGEVGDGEVVVGRQVLLRLCGYISVCPTLQLSHNDVPGVGLGWVLEPGGPESFPNSGCRVNPEFASEVGKLGKMMASKESTLQNSTIA